MYEDDSYHAQLLLADHHKPDKVMTALDGRVASILGDMIITSPNQSFVPELPTTRSINVFLRQDFRFGPDDATLWPQAYLAKYPHLGCIARKPSDPAVELGVMWWDPVEEDFKQCCDVAIRGIGRIASKEMTEMRNLKDELRKEVIEFLMRISSSKPLLVESCLTTMNHRWARLESMGAEYEAKRLEVVEFQRSWLELEAALIYFRSMVKRMQTEERPLRDPISSIGTVTNSPTVAQEFFAAGIPVWLMRPKVTLCGDIRIDRVIHCMRVQDSLCLERLEGYPDIFQGAFTDDAHYVEQHLFARSRLLAVSWINGEETTTDISEPQSLNLSSVASTSRSVQELKNHKTRIVEPAKPYQRVKSSQSSSKNSQTAAGREKFIEPKNPLTPPGITAWVTAMTKVTIWEQSIQKKQAAGQYETYVFPDPRWFLNAQDARCARLLRNWLKSRGTWMWRASYFQKNVPTMSISLWKEALHLGFGSGVKISLGTKKGEHIKKMAEYFGCSLNREGQLELPSGPTEDLLTEAEPIWKGKAIECSETQGPKGTVLTEAMWELYELNFRFDLLMLDRALTKSAEWDMEKQQERQLKIERCFDDAKHEDFRFAYPVLSCVNVGLANNSLEIRSFYIRQLALLMLDWNTPIPTTIAGLVNIKDLSNNDMRDFELVVTEFYCQCFYNQFGRAPLTPHRLYPPRRV